jgi:hypothetical protein
MEDFPPEAKDVIRKYESLSNFLLQNLKFAMIDKHLCLLKDTVKAKKLADEKMGTGTKYQSYSQSVSANTSLPVGHVTYSNSGTLLNPAAMEFNPLGSNLNLNSGERTHHGDLCEFELPAVPLLVGAKSKQQKYSEDEFPTLGDSGMNQPIRSNSASRTSLSDSPSSSCDDLKANLSDSKSGGNASPGLSLGGTMDVPPFLSGPPGATKKILPLKPRSDSSEKVPPFLSGPPLARNVSGSPIPRMASPKPASPKRASPRPPEVVEHKRSVADDFKRQVLEKLQQQKNNSGSESPPVNKGEDLGETYLSDSENSLDDLDGVDDVVVTATDTQKLDGEDYDGNLDMDVNKTFEKAVGNERSAPKTIFDLAPGISRDPSMYRWNVKELNGVANRGVGNNLNDMGKPENVSDNLFQKMQLAKEAWNSPVSSTNQSVGREFSSFPSVHSGPGFGGLPLKITPNSSFSSQSELNAAHKYSIDTGLDGIDNRDIFSEILDSNEDKNVDNASKHSDSFASDINASMEKEIDKMDKDFVHEFSSSVMEGLRHHSAFADDRNLADFVYSTIQKDLQRCAVSKALNSAVGSHLGGNNFGRTSMNQEILRKPAILCRSIAVQSEPLLGYVSRAVQTDPYEPYKLERDLLLQQLAEQTRLLTQTKTVCNSQRLRYAELKDSHEVR